MKSEHPGTNTYKAGDIEYLRLPYIGINVSRLPYLVKTAMLYPSGKRVELRDRFVMTFDCKEHTAKEYVNSLVNLRVIEEMPLRTYRFPWCNGEPQGVLLENFTRNESWSSFLEFLSSTNPVFELLREVAYREIRIRMADDFVFIEVVKAIWSQLEDRGLFLERRKTLEAYVRILQRCFLQNDKPGNRPEQVAMGHLSNVGPAYIGYLVKLIMDIENLRRHQGFYRNVSIISLSDLFETSPHGLDKRYQEALLLFRDRGLLTLHSTVPAMAESLGIRTIREGHRVYSGLSLSNSIKSELEGHSPT